MKIRSHTYTSTRTNPHIQTHNRVYTPKVLGPNGLANENVDGFYLDDHWTTYTGCGATEEDQNCNADMGLSPQDVADITGNWSTTSVAVLDVIKKDKGFALGGSSLFKGTGMRALTGKYGSDPRKTCAEYTRESCSKNSTVYTSAYIFQYTKKELFVDPFPMPFPFQDLAQFLLVRGPFAWIGYYYIYPYYH